MGSNAYGILRKSMARPAGHLLLMLATVGLANCSRGESVASFEPSTDPAQLFLSLRLDHHAINLSTASVTSATLQLAATPFNAAGEQMTGLPAPTFFSSDTTAVRVDSTGTLTALREVTGVWVVAEVVAPGNVRRADSALVNVTSTPPPTLASFSLDPVSPDSSIWSMSPDVSDESSPLVPFLTLAGVQSPSFPPTLRPHVFDANNTEITDGLAIEYASLDSAVAVVDRWTGVVTPLRPGSVHMVARTMAYGLSQTATATFTVTLPIGAAVAIYPTPNGSAMAGLRPDGLPVSEYRIAPYGIVVWSNRIAEAIDIKFDDPTNVAAVSATLCDGAFGTPPGSIIFGPGPHCGSGDVALPPLPPASDCLSPTVCILHTAQFRQFPVPGVYHFSSTQSGITGRIVVSAEGASGSTTGP